MLKGREAGLRILDSGQQFAAAMASMGSGPQLGASVGFSLRLYTPTTWVEQLASDAAKEYRPFSLAHITEDVMRPVLRVVVNPNVPTHLTASAMQGTSSVQHVVLQDENGRTVLQPVEKEPFDIPVTNAVGQGHQFSGIRAVFDLGSSANCLAPWNDRSSLLFDCGVSRQYDCRHLLARHQRKNGKVDAILVR